jgi:hypothetical protein
MARGQESSAGLEQSNIKRQSGQALSGRLQQPPCGIYKRARTMRTGVLTWARVTSPLR